LLFQQRSTGRDESVNIHPDDAVAPDSAEEVPIQNGLHGGPRREAITGRDQVNGGAHERDSHRAPREDEGGQPFRNEALEARPQANVGRVGRLGLDADQVLNCVGNCHAPALEQQLPLQQRAIQSAPTQHAAGTAGTLPVHSRALRDAPMRDALLEASEPECLHCLFEPTLTQRGL
jgi:hypothetical protein